MIQVNEGPLARKTAPASFVKPDFGVKAIPQDLGAVRKEVAQAIPA